MRRERHTVCEGCHARVPWSHVVSTSVCSVYVWGDAGPEEGWHEPRLHHTCNACMWWQTSRAWEPHVCARHVHDM